MQPSASKKPSDTPGYALAIAAETLYVVNLLLLPGIAFLLLLVLYSSQHKKAPPLAASHLSQTLSASLWAGLLLIAVNALILFLGGYDGPWTWVLLITYFTICHATLVMLGIVGLAMAMSGRCWSYPLVGRPLPPSCPGGKSV